MENNEAEQPVDVKIESDKETIKRETENATDEAEK